MTTSTHEEVPRVGLADFVQDYMAEHFETADFVTLHARTMGTAFNFTGYTCMAQDRHPCGYDIYLFEGTTTQVMVFVDAMTTKCVVCANLPMEDTTEET